MTAPTAERGVKRTDNGEYYLVTCPGVHFPTEWAARSWDTENELYAYVDSLTGDYGQLEFNRKEWAIYYSLVAKTKLYSAMDWVEQRPAVGMAIAAVIGLVMSWVIFG